MSQSEYRAKMRLQRVLGVVLLVLSFFMLKMSIGVPPDDSLATPTLITIPLGMYMLFGKQLMLS